MLGYNAGFVERAAMKKRGKKKKKSMTQLCSSFQQNMYALLPFNLCRM